YRSGWLPTASLSIQQKLSFSSSVYQPNSLNFICQILFCLTTHQSHLSNQQEISVSSLTQTFALTNTYLISQRFATFISVTSDAYAQLWTSTPPVTSQHLWFILSSTILQLSLLQPSTVAAQATPGYPKLLGSLHHFQLSFPTHNTGTKISSLAKVEQRIQYKLISLTYSSLQHN